jgi:hypothetical protein
MPQGTCAPCTEAAATGCTADGCSRWFDGSGFTLSLSSRRAGAGCPGASVRVRARERERTAANSGTDGGWCSPRARARSVFDSAIRTPTASARRRAPGAVARGPSRRMPLRASAPSSSRITHDGAPPPGLAARRRHHEPLCDISSKSETAHARTHDLSDRAGARRCHQAARAAMLPGQKCGPCVSK